ncbi:MAG: 2-oxoacid:ferredoxin oxidoreductase subunit beta [Gammaproteobacteria bacterium]|nr:2-oxoacid:ferredoxin oxidoreductase subunit beta [Gammaproteobacteria bacterium]
MSDLSFKDFATDQEVRWCPGCGDYAILKAIQRALAKDGATPENTVFVSGIGCAARTPYYVNTYGFHTIHGRAPAIATGVKLANPALDVWVVTGDGDGLSIGGNHLLHALRRNIDLNILLFNNEIYGLTKGQYSPTSRPGTVSPSSPGGSFEQPISPGQFAMGAGATFFARGVDIDQKGMPDLFNAAKHHQGTSFVEILQNCIVYNKDVFDDVVSKKNAAQAQIHVQHGQPLLYGKEQQLGLRLNSKSLSLETVTLGEGGITLDDILVHDETNAVMAQILVNLESPTAMGVIRRVKQPTFDSGYWKSHHPERRTKVKQLIYTGNLVDHRSP